MANRLRGEATFRARDIEYTIRIGTNEIIEIGTALGVKGAELTERLKQMLLEDARTILHIALGRHHEGLSPETVGELMDEIGDAAGEPALLATWKVLGSAFNRSTQGEQAAQGEAVAPNP